MSRSYDQFPYTRGGDCGGEYGSKRLGGWPTAGRFTKTLTHRVERRQADLQTLQDYFEFLQEQQDDSTAPVEVTAPTCGRERFDAYRGNCPNDATQPHTCPFKSDLYDDRTLCTCCRSCRSECARDI